MKDSSKYIKIVLFSTLGLATVVNGDNLKFNTITKKGVSVSVIVPDVEYKNDDDSVIDKVEKACNTALFIGDNNIKNETPNEAKCTDDGIDAYDDKFLKVQKELAERLDAETERLRKDTAKNYKTAERLRKDTANKMFIIKKLENIKKIK